MEQEQGRIMIMTDVASDADLVNFVLKDDYPDTHLAVKPASFAAEFDEYRPEIQLFAFRTLEASERYHHEMYGQSKLINELPHISLVLCDKDEARHGFELCQSDIFDDYVLFWPMAHDARRLPMSVHLAFRNLHSQNALGSMAQLTAQARRIAELDARLDKVLKAGADHSKTMQLAVKHAQAEVGSALQRIAKGIAQPANNDVSKAGALECVQREIQNLKSSSMQAPFGSADKSLQELQQWIDALKSELEAPLQAARELVAKSERRRPRILVVDDDEIMRKLLKKILGAQNYDADAAPNAFSALKLIQTQTPDLILMDVQMPNIDGVELTRRLKAIEAFSKIPILMLTGRGEREIILNSRAAGAADFIVKPFERDILIQKLNRYLHQRDEAPVH